MCDYSLHGVSNRLAVKGDQLFVHMFNKFSKGLASKTDFDAARPNALRRFAAFFLTPGENPLRAIPAVCVPPGAQLRLSGLPKWMRDGYGVSETEDVTFTQVTNEPFSYRDAFRFANGKEALIQKFPEGVRVEVLQIEIEEMTQTAPVVANEGLISEAIRSLD